jgi:hypothetical protein
VVSTGDQNRTGRCITQATGYKRNRVFRYAPYIAIFGDHPPAAPSELQGEQP